MARGCLNRAWYASPVVPLEMKTRCEKCDASLDKLAEAFICSFECTFCPTCTGEVEARCPNCGGELLRRPRREI